MATSFGLKLGIDGEKEFKQAVSSINNSMRVTASELKAVSSEFTKQTKTVGDAKRENEIFGKSIDTLKTRLDAQRKGLENATAQYGEADKRTLAWKVSINNTLSEINKYNNRIEENDKAIEGASKSTKKMTDDTLLFGDGVEDAGKKVLSFGDIVKANLISDAIVGGVKALASAVGTVVNATIDLGKQAVEGFAEYEQLIGGVETLFGESSNVVEKYANNAFKTAGLNANQYMETVTSFSASLLQSLNGDTAKAAGVADMAITDMADNANKMGTSMESIQNAYQGFAKQNYTMLDNLKLGYGGTKSEMERLLKDATTLSGVEYNIDNLNDVYEAIHVVQTELGITGTTAKEASETITGSIGTFKSSWSNLLTGLANGNADLTNLIDSVVDSALSVVDNLLPVISQVAESIMAVLPKVLEKISEKLPEFLDVGIGVIESLMNGVLDSLPLLLDTAVSVVMKLIEKVVEFLPDLIKLGIEVLVSLINGIATTIPTLIPVIVDAVITIVETLLDNLDLLIGAGIELLLAITMGLIDAIPVLIGKIPLIIEKLVSAIISNLPKLLSAGITILVEIGKGLIKAIPQLIGMIPQIITSIIKAFINTDWKKVGKDILGGIGDGIKGAVSNVVSAAKNAAASVFNGVKSFFGINSPSRLFRDEVGKNLALGLGDGFEGEMDDISSRMVQAVPTDFESNATVNTNFKSTSSVFDKLADVIEAVTKKDSIMVLDTGEFVGATTSTYDDSFGSAQALKLRGVTV